MFKSVIYKPTEEEVLNHNTVSEAITYVSTMLDSGIVSTGLIEYESTFIALIYRETNLTVIKVYDSNQVTNNLNLSLSTPIKFEVVNSKSNQSILNNVIVGGDIILGDLHQSN